MKNITVFLVMISIVLSWGNQFFDSQGYSADQKNINQLFTLSLEELMGLKISGATLTSLSHGETPAAITVITAEQIARSGARSLDEVLEIYVPGLQLMGKSNGTMMGVRGIISDRNNKLLMVVNGRPMTIKTREGGALSERYLSMLGDIETITVIRNPGSAVHGPGAIAGIIRIETKTGSNQEGLTATMTAGAIEDFKNVQLQYGTTFANGISLYAYYGIDSYDGASSEDAPLKFSHDFVTGEDDSVFANEAVPFKVKESNATYFDKYRHKAHLQIQGDNFTLWSRYTLGANGKVPGSFVYTGAPWNNYASEPSLEKFLGWGILYQQFTLYGLYTHQILPTLSVDFVASSQISHNQWNRNGFNFGEYEHLGSTIFRYSPNTSHNAVVGFEGIYDQFGRDSPYNSFDSSYFDDDQVNLVPKGTEWETLHYSVFGEHQWRIAQPLLLLAGARADKHTYTDWMLSPRASIIYSPTSSDVVKLMALRSVRKPDDFDLYKADYQSENNKEMEVMKSYEVRYEKQVTESHRLMASSYYNNLTIVAWSWNKHYSIVLGDLQLFGLDGEWEYKGALGRFSLSHNYTKLINFNGEESEANNNISASLYGYGNDLANWSSHSTKLSLSWNMTQKLSSTSSIRAYWWYPGAQDNADYNMTENAVPDVFGPRYDSGKTRAFEQSIYFNTGIQYVLDDNCTIKLNGYNLLGFIDADLNKQNIFQETSTYRILAPSFSASVAVSL